MENVFVEKDLKPNDERLQTVLGATCRFWQNLVDYVRSVYPKVIEEWNFSKSAGWNLRLKDNKRAIIYLLPRADFFQIALVFGQKATNEVMKSHVSIGIKAELEAAKAYAEGRGIRLDVKDEEIIDDIKELINIKIEN